MLKSFKIFILSFLFLPLNFVFAGVISVNKILPETNDLKVGDEVLLNVLLDSEGVVYNAIEGELTIPSNLQIDKVVTGNSFISIWLENPANFNLNNIRFSGISPAGFNNEEGIIFSVILKVLNKGSGRVELKDSSIFRNDGEGTDDIPKFDSIFLETRNIKSNEDPYLVSVKDETPPEEFKLELVRDLNVFDGKYTLVFSTQDKGSGIKYYDVTEGRDVFKQVQSPYVLKNQSLNEKIYVRAVDLEGNERVALFIPPNKVCLGVSCYGVLQIIIFVIIVFGLGFLIWRKRRKLFLR